MVEVPQRKFSPNWTRIDDKVSEEEFLGKKTGEKAEKAKKLFARRDKDKDGSLTLEEFIAKKKKKE